MHTNIQSQKKISGIVLAILIATSPSLPTLVAFSKSANAGQYVPPCSCVQYVENARGIDLRGPEYAKDTGPIIERNGHSKVSSPQHGDIVVMQPSFPGADTTAGHIGFVETVTYRNNRTYITVRGANQPQQYGKYFIEYSCSNVNVTPFGAPVDGNPNIAFYRRNVSNNAIREEPVFTGYSLPTGENSYSETTTSSTIMRNIAPNSILYFSAWTYGEALPSQTRQDRQLDARWYRLNGTNEWVPGAQVLGSFPGTTPMP